MLRHPQRRGPRESIRHVAIRDPRGTRPRPREGLRLRMGGSEQGYGAPRDRTGLQILARSYHGGVYCAPHSLPPTRQGLRGQLAVIPHPELRRQLALLLQHHQRRRGHAIAMIDPAPFIDYIDWSNHANSLYEKGETNLALGAAITAASLARTPGTLLNLAVINETQGEFRHALALYKEAHALAPDDKLVACGYFHALVRMGRFKDAWKLSYAHADWGWVNRIWPEWDGITSLAGKRLLVLSGGGYGDNILFLRWMPRLKALGAHVTFMCPPSLHSRLRRDAPPSRLRLLHLSPHAGQTLLSHSGGYSHGTVYRRTQVSCLACRLLYPRGGREVPSPPSFSHARAGETYKSDPRSMGGLGFRCPYDVEAYGCDSLQYRTHRHRGHWRGPSRWGNEYSVLGHPPRLLRLLLRH